MTYEQKVAMVKNCIDDGVNLATDELCGVYLQLAASKILERLYPYDISKQDSDIPVRYDTLQCELAVRLYSRKGGEGESSHEENGVNRTFGSVDDEDILSRLTPFAKVGG